MKNITPILYLSDTNGRKEIKSLNAKGKFSSSLSDEFSICLVRHRADGSSTLLKVSPSLVMSLSLVEIDGSCIFIHLVEPKLVLVTLVPQYIWWPGKKKKMRERKKSPFFPPKHTSPLQQKRKTLTYQIGCNQVPCENFQHLS